MPEIFLITGISAAGKSTVAQNLAERFERGVHVKGDVYRRMVVSGQDHLHPDQLDLRYRLGAETANAFFEAGFDVVVQDIVMGPALTTYVARITARPLYVVVLTPRVDVVEQREAQRPKTAYQPGRYTPADLDTYLRDETPRIGLWIDTSDQSPDETMDEILARKDEAGV